MNFYIYITTNLINRKRYIGKRTTSKEISLDSYLGSGLYLLKAVKKYGKENFKKEILEICESGEILNERERYWISFYRADGRNNMFYNIVPGGQGGFRGMTEEGRRRISEANKKRVYSEEVLKKMSLGLKGKLAWNKGLSLPRGKKQTEEHIRKRVEKRKQTLKASGSSLLGRRYSLEHRIKISESAKLRWKLRKAKLSTGKV